MSFCTAYSLIGNCHVLLHQSRKMKLLVRSKAVCHDDGYDTLDLDFPLGSPLSSSTSCISNSIFPSPFPITREEVSSVHVPHVAAISQPVVSWS